MLSIKKMYESLGGTIASDPRTNRIIIRDYPDKLDEYGKIIKELDKPMKMVKIDVTIVQASKDFAREFGIGIMGRKNYATSKDQAHRYDWGTSGEAREVFDEQFISNTETALNLIPLSETAAGIPISSYGLAGTFLYEGARAILGATLIAAETKGVSKTINKSSIVTMDNMKAIVQNTTTITYKLQTGGDEPTIEDEELEAGIVLTTTPHIIETEDNRKFIELVILAERSSFLSSRTDDIPHEAETSLNTQAVVGNNQTLVIGGFFDNAYAKGETGIPCLMNIPALGHLFKTASTRNPKNNILFFLTPSIISLNEIPHEEHGLVETIKKDETELKQIGPKILKKRK